ncbi:MAG: NERD domain-containing protein [Syntrophorhabdales bacterium]|jgi:hypothetical protein
MNRSEEFVSDLCTKSFLSLWSYSNPRMKDSPKELCDVLVVCDPDVIIFSVKEIGLKEGGDPTVDVARWRRKAVESSIKQIYGAERHLKFMTDVVTKEGKIGVTLPLVPNRQVHRVAVALGSKGKVPVSFEDFGKGFIHVFDEVSLPNIMIELDTITDFVTYLKDKETLYSSGIETVLNGGEEDLLALYLHNGRAFPVGRDLLVLDDSLWQAFTNKPEYLAKKKEDEASYIWDRLIEIFCRDFLTCGLEFGNSLTNVEHVMRTMARENRFSRRVMAKTFLEFYERKGQKKVRARMAPSPSGVLYVFLALPRGEDRKYRVAELGARCLVARGLNPEHPTVIGIATEQYEEGQGFSLDAYYFYKEDWTAEDQQRSEYFQREFGFFSAPRVSQAHEDEYPVC